MTALEGNLGYPSFLKSFTIPNALALPGLVTKHGTRQQASTTFKIYSVINLLCFSWNESVADWQFGVAGAPVCLFSNAIFSPGRSPRFYVLECLGERKRRRYGGAAMRGGENTILAPAK